MVLFSWKRRRPFLSCTAPLFSLRSGRAGRCDKGLETRTGFLISQIKQVQGRVFDRLLQSCGVAEFNGPQGRILYVLWQSEGIPIVELAQKTGLAKNTLTAMLGRMEQNGLIAREASSLDKRQSLIRLTPKARALKKRYHQVSRQMDDLFFQNFKRKEIEELEQYLDRIVSNLEQTEQALKKGKDLQYGKSENEDRQ